MSTNIYEEINEKLEDKNLNSAEIAAIGFTPSMGHYVQLDDGSRRQVNNHDYWLLDDYLEAMHQAYLAQCAQVEAQVEAIAD